MSRIECNKTGSHLTRPMIMKIYAEVVNRIASGLEAGGLPWYPEDSFVEIKVMKCCNTLLNTNDVDARS